MFGGMRRMCGFLKRLQFTSWRNCVFQETRRPGDQEHQRQGGKTREEFSYFEEIFPIFFLSLKQGFLLRFRSLFQQRFHVHWLGVWLHGVWGGWKLTVCRCMQAFPVNVAVVYWQFVNVFPGLMDIWPENLSSCCEKCLAVSLCSFPFNIYEDFCAVIVRCSLGLV